MLKDILVFAGSLDQDEPALALADQIAAAHNAQVHCMALSVLPDGFLGFSEGARTGTIATMILEARQETRKRVEQLKDALLQRPKPVELEQMEVYPSGLEAAVAERARRSDLVIVRAAPQSRETGHAAVIEAALLAGGAPVLIVPLHWRPGAFGRRVLIGWDQSREAARAAHDALRLIAPDAAVMVACVSDEDDPKLLESARRFAAHLARGALVADAKVYPVTQRSVAATLEHIAQEFGADMIVAGGFRHSRVQQALFGGVTRTLLHAPPHPIFLAH